MRRTTCTVQCTSAAPSTQFVGTTRSKFKTGIKVNMELYGRTEIDTYYPTADFSLSRHFVVVRFGWFSFAYLLGEEDTPGTDSRSMAMEITNALYELDA